MESASLPLTISAIAPLWKKLYSKELYNGCSMICVVIKGPTIAEARQQIAQAILEADLIELRLDLFTHLDREAFETLRKEFPIPMIFTLRGLKQGGSYSESEEK